MSESKNYNWITVKVAAKFRRCSERNILDLIKRGTLKGKKEGRRWLVWMDVPEEPAEDIPNVSEVHVATAFSTLTQQLEEKDKQIAKLQDELSEASQRHDTIVLQLTRQLEQSQRLLEYNQEPWYRRWFKRKL